MEKVINLNHMNGFLSISKFYGKFKLHQYQKCSPRQDMLPLIGDTEKCIMRLRELQFKGNCW